MGWVTNTAEIAQEFDMGNVGQTYDRDLFYHILFTRHLNALTMAKSALGKHYICSNSIINTLSVVLSTIGRLVKFTL